MKTIVVFGASSSIGSKFIQKALTRKITIVAFARNKDKIPTSLKIKIISGDITKLQNVRQAFWGSKVYATINFAASFSSDLSIARKVNIKGEQNILKASKEFAVKRHIYISTIATLAPSASAYRDTKLEAENAVKKSDLDWIILRYANVLGTPTWDQPFKLIIPFLRIGIPKVPTSNMSAVFPYATINTTIEATLAALTARPNQTITVFDGKTTIGEYLHRQEKIHSVKKSFMPLPILQFVNKYLGGLISQIPAMVAGLEFMANPPALENTTMKRELHIKTRKNFY